MTSSAISSEIAQKYLVGILDKKGFEAYQSIRDFFVEIFSAPEKAAPFITDQSHFRVLSDFQLFDQAYIDNMTLCLIIKIKAPQEYKELLKIIDRQVRPTSHNEGFNQLYQECGAFLALLLEHYEGVSNRHAIFAASQLTEYSESTIEKSYRNRMTTLLEKFKGDLPPTMTLVALYWTLHAKKVSPNKLKPFEEESTKSKGEIQKTISAYWRLAEKIIRHHHEKVLQYLKGHPVKIFSVVAKDYNLNFPLLEEDLKKADAFAVFFVVSAALLIEIMPKELEKMDELIKEIT